jgi:hydroxymethylbilane synthase
VLPSRLRIATRESRLALWQAEHVAGALRARHAGLAVELVGMTTRGDQVLDRPLSQVGGKGLFVKELEVALIEDRADLAVHSMKDVPMLLPEGFAILAFGVREEALDAFVSVHHAGIASLAAGAVVGTSSLRRECQLRRAYPRLAFRPLRGNVNTRLAKLDAGDYDAIILAAAGLRRLGFEARIRERLDTAIALPAIAQGILGVEFLSARADVAELLAGFVDPATQAAADAERALGLVVEGSCEVPLGAYAQAAGAALALEAFVGLPDGTRLVREHASGSVNAAAALGNTLGRQLLARGGREILDALPKAVA